MMAPAATPMMAQYLALKEQAGDCLLFYRMGDFFELFFEDAQIAAAALDIALTHRGEHGGAPVPMCGVPVHAAETYLARLIRAGHRVAIAEQVESPAEAKKRGGSKALVARAIVRFVTAGTLTEEALLEPKRASVLAAVCELRGVFAIATCDVSTGRMELEECDPAELEDALARIAPTELIAPMDCPLGVRTAITCERHDFSSERGEQRLRALHKVGALDGFGHFTRPMLAAASGLLAYLDKAGTGSLPLLLPPVARTTANTLAMDEATRTSLEILEAQGGGRDGSLLAAVDRCVTAAGARLLAADLAAPFARRDKIDERLALVRFWHDDPLKRADLRAALRAIPDFGRALGRVVAGRGSPRDLGQVRDGLCGAGALARMLAESVERPELLDLLLRHLAGHESLVDLLTRALVATPPSERTGGGFIAPGYDEALDELREISRNARRAITALETRYRAETGISTLKIKHNNVLGYFIEAPARHADALIQAGSNFTHRQTMASAMRFNSLRLHEEAGRITEAGGRALIAEEAHFEDLAQQVGEARLAIAATAAACARLDVSGGQAERASEGAWCRPEMVDQPCLEIAAGRHPVVEAALEGVGARFVANDCKLDAHDRLWLIGGPNMGGKSTFLRQNALIVLLAQAGGYVPAAKARVGLVDRLFSRVGAADNLARGRSTFMVEMVETAAILRQATEKSFVILDEVGRGTSTYDGLALAWAVAEAIHEQTRCRCLFASHYHELALLGETCAALSLHHVRVKEWKGELVLLHEVAQGAADRSYGLDVARLAGVPRPVIARARQVLAKLEKGREETGGLTAGLGDLPLFAAADITRTEQVDMLHERLAKLDIDTLSPREALDLLYALKREAGTG